MSVKSQIQQAGDFIKSNICKEDEKQLNNSRLNTNKKRLINTYIPSTATTVDSYNTDYTKLSPFSIMSDDAESMFIIGSIVVVETGWGHSFEGNFKIIINK